MDHQACQYSSRCRRCHREGRRCSCSIHLWSGRGHDRSHRPIKENRISNEVPAPILQNYPLTTTTAHDTTTNHPRHPKLITLSLFVAKYAGYYILGAYSQYRPRPRPTMALGPPPIARHGRHRICRRYDTNGKHVPGHPSPRLHTTKWELADALVRSDMSYVPMAGHGPSPGASRRLRGRDTNTCRRRRQVMCLILPRSPCNPPVYSDYAPLGG